MPKANSSHSNFRRFFLRGLGILLPSVLTVWILIAAYNFVQGRIAQPINAGIRFMVVQFSPYPEVTEQQRESFANSLRSNQNDPLYKAWAKRDFSETFLANAARRAELREWWRQYSWGLDLIGLFIAIMGIYIAGAVLGSFIGARLVSRGESFLRKLPLVRQVYPAVKQVTDFIVGDRPGLPGEGQAQFSKVVAVQYPRKGLWSVGLLTGDTMRVIEQEARATCLTVFIPSSPTPFTGYVITVPKEDTIELPISIEEALQFTISGGVVVPASQVIRRGDEPPEGPAPPARADLS